MIVSFPPTVRDRLEAIEAEEGVPVLEQVVQAVSIWSHLRGEAERRSIGFAVMRTVVYRSASTEP